MFLIPPHSNSCMIQAGAKCTVYVFIVPSSLNYPMWSWPNTFNVTNVQLCEQKTSRQFLEIKKTRFMIFPHFLFHFFTRIKNVQFSIWIEMVIGQEVLKNAIVIPNFLQYIWFIKAKLTFFASLKCHDISFWHLSQIHVSYECPEL